MLRSARAGWLVALCGLTLMAACSTTQGRFVPTGATVAPRAADAPVELFRTGLPSRAFERVARLDAHLEKTAFRSSDLEDALPELMRQARRAGADAIIEPREQRSQVGETMIYHVTATGIRYKD
jgi:hypothetical protein